MLNHPVIRFTHIRLEQNGSDIRVVCWTKRVSNVVQQSTDNVFLVFTIFMSKRGCLQAVRQTIDGEAAAVTL